MRENWQGLFLKGLEMETDVFRLGDLFKQNAAREHPSDKLRAQGNPRVGAVAPQQIDDAVPAQMSEVVVRARRPDWLHRQMSRARYGLEDFVNGRPSNGQAYYGLPGVQPRTPQEQAKHSEFIRQREAFQDQVKSNDHLQRNVDAARHDPRKYAGDVALGTLKGAGQEGLNLANSALAGYGLLHPEAAASADSINRLTGKRVFDLSQNPWGMPTAQVAQPNSLRPRGDIQHQWSYLGHLGGMVGTGAAAEAMLPARVIAPAYRPLKLPATPNGQYYSVAYEAKLNPADWAQRHEVHLNRANCQLDDALLSDPGWAAGMEEMIPGLRQSVSKVGGRSKPAGWTWHHDGVPRPPTAGADEYGFLQLTPKSQHSAGSIFWNSLHPDPQGRGGYAIWAIPAGAPPRR